MILEARKSSKEQSLQRKKIGKKKEEQKQAEKAKSS